MEAALAEARELLSRAQRVVFFTGAGLGADSGIPTFRGPGGLWEGFRAEELATPQAFHRNPGMVWRWYRWRRSRIAEASPHAGHLAIARYQRSRPATEVVTQNVDGMHQRSGCDRVVELHGSIWAHRCEACGRERAADETDSAATGEEVPTCPCGGRERPGVVWFGEALPAAPFAEAERILSAACVVVVVGTSGVVQPAASLLACGESRGSALIEVNPEPVLGSRAVRLASGAAHALPLLLDLHDSNSSS